MRKKMLAFVFAGGLLMSLGVPLFGGVGAASADQPANPGCIGEAVSVQAQAGERAEVVALVKATTGEKNFGQAIQAWKGPACGIPPGHTP